MPRTYAMRRLLAAATCISLLSGCAPSEEESSFLARRALLLRQNQGIRELIEEEERGSLVPTGRFLVGIHESIVGDLFRTQLPIERPLGKQFIVHLDSADVSLVDKFGVIRIKGEIHRRKTPDRKIAVRLDGGLGAVAVDSVTQRLHVAIAIDRIELLEAGMLESVLGHGGRKFLSEKALPRIQEALPEFEIPVELGRAIQVPAIREEGVRLDSLQVPLKLSVHSVLAAGGKLWVTLDADVGRVTGAEKGLGVSVKKKPKKGAAK